MKRRIHRRCKCGCGGITNYGRKWISGHSSTVTKLGNAYMLGHKHSKETKRKISLAMNNLSKKTKLKMSLAKMGNTNRLGKKHSEETKRKMSLSRTRCHSNSLYCDAWHDTEYKNDLRKNYCEKTNCKKQSILFLNHHINLNKKDCRPINIMTLCRSCHATLHDKLARRKNYLPTAFPKDYIIINRPDHVSYIHKQTREIIKLKRRIKNEK